MLPRSRLSTLITTGLGNPPGRDGTISSTTPATVTGVDALAVCVSEHGILAEHLQILSAFADEHDVVIAFRQVNPLATGLIAQGCPTKDLNIKGKSADWGPMAGFIPVQQAFSKLSGRADRIRAANREVEACLHAGLAQQIPLALGRERLDELVERGLIRIQGRLWTSENIGIECEREGVAYLFSASLSRAGAKPVYAIQYEGSPLMVLAKEDGSGTRRPMTADYDLFMFAPRIEHYGELDNYRQSDPEEGNATGASPATESDPSSRPTWDEHARGAELASPASPPSEASAASQSGADMLPGRRFSTSSMLSNASTVSSTASSNRGVISPRLDALIPALNSALGRDDPRDALIHHGPDTHNPGSSMYDNLPSTFFAPRRVPGLDGAAMSRNLSEIESIMTRIKDSGYQFFSNRNWQDQLPAERTRRRSFNEAQRPGGALHAAFRRRGSFEHHGPAGRGASFSDETTGRRGSSAGSQGAGERVVHFGEAQSEGRTGREYTGEPEGAGQRTGTESPMSPVSPVSPLDNFLSRRRSYGQLSLRPPPEIGADVERDDAPSPPDPAALDKGRIK